MSNERTMSETLRAVAELIDLHSDLPTPYVVVHSSGSASATWGLSYGLDRADQPAEAARIIKAIGGTWVKDFEWDHDRADFHQTRDGIELRIVLERSAVCERIVTGSQVVTIPAQDERVETVETVEWRCMPLLSDARVSA